MDTNIKVWLIVGAALVILGALIFTVVMSIHHWDFSRLSTVKYVTNTHSITQAFTSIALDLDTAQLRLVPADDGRCEVVCYEDENALHSVTLEDGCLRIQVNNQRKWYHYIHIIEGSPKITVTLPQGVYQSLLAKVSTGDLEIARDFSFQTVDITGTTGNVDCFASASEHLNIKVSTGNIQVQNISAGDVSLVVSTGGINATDLSCTGILTLRTNTGKATLRNVSCEALSSTGNTGRITLENVTVARDLSVTRSTGDVTFVKCDAQTLNITTGTGDVTGSLLSDKVFITKTGTGHVKVPETTTGGQCKITTGTGDIRITIEE